MVTNSNDRCVAIEHLLNAMSANKKVIEILSRFIQSDCQEAKLTHNNTNQADSIAELQSAALSHTEKFFEVIQSNLLPNDPFMAGVCNNIVTILLGAKDYSGALSYFEKALDILNKFFSSNNSMLAMTFSNLAKALDGRGQFEEAIDYARQAVNTAYADFGSNDDVIKSYEDQLDRLQRKL